MKFNLFFTMLFLVFACNEEGKKSEKPNTLKEEKSLTSWLDSTISSSMEKHDKPSAAIGIIKDGSVYYTNGYGTLSRNSNRPVEATSVFQIASVSKMFTGLIVAHLIEEGKLNLDHKITTYLNPVLSRETQILFSEITLGDLMQHKAGIPNYGCSVYLKAKQGGNYYWEKGYSKEEFISDINQMKLEYDPGTQQSYSNSGYNLVGLILEEVTGKSYAELVDYYLTGPLKLKNTFVDTKSHSKQNMVTAYPPSEPYRPSKISDWGYATPATGIFSTVEDLLKILDKQLAAYQLFEKTKKVTPFLLINRPDLNSDTEWNYGLGFFERKGPNGSILFQHDGDADGYTVFYTMHPSKNMGKILMTSSGGNWFLELDNQIENQLFTETKN